MAQDQFKREAHPGHPPPLRATAEQRRTSARLESLLAELDRPLEDIDWRHTTIAGAETTADRCSREREHRRELHRAREAAQRAFGTKPRLSARKRATIMLTGGAVGLAAFASPVAPHGRDHARSPQIEMTSQPARAPASHLKASDEFKKALMQEEGVRYTVYRDVAGYPTVGVGHLVKPGDGLSVGQQVSQSQVMRFLEQDLVIAERGVRDLVGDLPLHQHEFDALLDLVYNVGRGNVDERSSPRLNEAIAAADYDAIASELEYTQAAGQVARGLEFRSDRRAAIFTEAAYEDPRLQRS